MNADWILLWRKWMSGKGAKYPGKITNKPIADKIMNYRITEKNLLHDNGISFKEPEEIYVLSEAFFRGFSERYGVDIEI